MADLAAEQRMIAIQQAYEQRYRPSYLRTDGSFNYNHYADEHEEEDYTGPDVDRYQITSEEIEAAVSESEKQARIKKSYTQAQFDDLNGKTFRILDVRTLWQALENGQEASLIKTTKEVVAEFMDDPNPRGTINETEMASRFALNHDYDRPSSSGYSDHKKW